MDLVFGVEAFPTAPGKYRASDRWEVGGGVAATAAATVAALGGDAVFIGCVGDDATGDAIVTDLSALGVDTGGVRRVPGGRSPLSAVLVDAAGERLIVNHADADLFDRAAPLAPSELAGADAVLADMRWPAAARVALETGRAAGVPAVLDCDHDPTGHPAVLAAATHAVFALPTLAGFVGHEDAAAALRAGRAHTEGEIVATDGDAGVFWLDGDDVCHLPAFAVEVVDTLGAGDVFHGALALALAEDRPLDDALRWAGAAAAIKCSRPGGRAGMPNRAEVDRFVEEQS